MRKMLCRRRRRRPFCVRFECAGEMWKFFEGMTRINMNLSSAPHTTTQYQELEIMLVSRCG